MYFLRSLIYPIFSPAFYAEAIGKGGRKALTVYTLFTILITILGSLYFAATFGYSLYKLQDKVDDINFPDVQLEDGTLSTNPEKAYDLSDETQFLVLDTSGSTTEIPEKYDQGFLFTEKEVLIRTPDLNEDQTLTYDEIATEFDIDSFSLTKEDIVDFGQKAGIGIILVSPLFIFLAYFFGRLISVFLVAILGLIVLSVMGEDNPFRKSFIIAMYASIPVFYVGVLFSGMGKLMGFAGITFSIASICCLVPLIFSLVKWFLFWGIGAWGVINSKSEAEPATQAQKQ